MWIRLPIKTPVFGLRLLSRDDQPMKRTINIQLSRALDIHGVVYVGFKKTEKSIWSRFFSQIFAWSFIGLNLQNNINQYQAKSDSLHTNTKNHSVSGSIGWLVGQLVGWSVGWLVGWSVGWSFGC